MDEIMDYNFSTIVFDRIFFLNDVCFALLIISKNAGTWEHFKTITLVLKKYGCTCTLAANFILSYNGLICVNT